MNSTIVPLIEDQNILANQPIAQLPEATDVEVNRFKYAEFAGPDGRGLLTNICKQILPRACFDMWNSSVSYQKPGHDCYVGAARQQRDLAIRGELVERTIRRRWQQLQDRGLVQFEDKLIEVNDERGPHYEVRHIKNFAKLYDLAHEFYCWWKSSSYIAPVRENVNIINSNPELARWLLRFDCYKVILLEERRGCKPGPKIDYQERLEQRYTEKMKAKDVEIGNSEEKNADRQVFSKCFSKSFAVNTNDNTNNPYEESSSKHLEETVVAPTTIRNDGNPISEKETGIMIPSLQHQHEPNSEKTAREEENGAASVLQNDHETLIREIVSAAVGNSPRQLVENIMRGLCPLLNDAAPLASTTTQANNVFVRACVLDPDVIKQVIEQCVVFVCSLPDEDIHIRNKANGLGNRVPMFIKSLSGRIPAVYAQRRKARAIQAQELERQASQSSQVDVPVHTISPAEPVVQVSETTEIEVVADDEQRQAALALRQRAQVLLDAVDQTGLYLSPQQREAIECGDRAQIEHVQTMLENFQHQQRVQAEYEASLIQARDAVKGIMEAGEHILLRSQPCQHCGNLIYCRVHMTFQCVVCEPLGHWSDPQYVQVCQIVRAIPTWEQIEESFEE